MTETQTEVIRYEQVEIETRLFELAQRKAKVYSESSLVPTEYQGNIGNVLIATNMAKRMECDLLMVMQNLYVVNGRPGWSSQFLIACFNSCRRFAAIKYRFTGERRKDSWGCVAFTKEMDTGDPIEGTEVTFEMAKSEGWVSKKGSKWQTIPEQMLRYRSAAFMIRTTAPEIGMGLLTREELEDMYEVRRLPPTTVESSNPAFSGATASFVDHPHRQATNLPDDRREYVAGEPAHPEMATQPPVADTAKDTVGEREPNVPVEDKPRWGPEVMEIFEDVRKAKTATSLMHAKNKWAALVAANPDARETVEAFIGAREEQIKVLGGGK